MLLARKTILHYLHSPDDVAFRRQLVANRAGWKEGRQVPQGHLATHIALMNTGTSQLELITKLLSSSVKDCTMVSMFHLH